jgi:hypothetical protein
LARSSNQDELNEMIARGASLANRNVVAPAGKSAVPVKR